MDQNISNNDLMKKYNELLIKYQNEKEKNSKITTQNSELATQNTELKIKIENQQLEINQLRKFLFGPKRENTPKNENIVKGTQCSLFDEIEEEELNQQVEEEVEKVTVHRKKNAKKVKSGIKKSELNNIEKQKMLFSLEEGSLVCPKCGSELKEIGQKAVRTEIEYIPAKLIIKVYFSKTYKCTKCGKENSENETSTIINASTPKALLPHSFATSSLATEVIYQKYYMGVPLYRQEKVWDDRGLVLPRQMAANWCIKISEYYLEPIYELILKQMKETSQLLHCDETGIQCNKEKGKKASSKSYMWVLVSGEDEEKKGVIFKYASSRSGKEAKELLEGYKKVLVTDGYDGYNNLPEINRAECWAHARRYFYASVPLDEKKQMIQTSEGYTGVKYINDLFEIEQEIKDLPVEEKVQKRQEKSVPILKKFYDWVYSTNQKVITNDKLKKAITYAINQKEELSKFIDDGHIPLTNSKAERAIRPFAVHRKNWLFADTPGGAKANAIYYSLIESAKANKLNIYKYIKYLLDELPQFEEAKTEKELEKYMPWSRDLPKDIINFQGTYKDVEIKDENQ